jgi:cell pole-organizing protein PopZ
MSVPQVKEGPASMLRAMFAGFGSLLSVLDKVRAKPAAEAPADAEAPAAATTQAPEDTAAPEAATADPAAVAAEVTTAPETAVVAEAPAEPAAPAAPEAPVAAEVPEATEASASPETSGALPLANYDELTVASLRARLRNLSNDDLTQLMSYEREHQNRPEVIKMFQNRLIKMTSGFQKLEA